MKLIKGTDLTSEQRREVLDAFIYRRLNTAIYPVQHDMVDMTLYDVLCRNLDSVWLQHYAFWFRKDGHLAHRHAARHLF